MAAADRCGFASKFSRQSNSRAKSARISPPVEIAAIWRSGLLIKNMTPPNNSKFYVSFDFSFIRNPPNASHWLQIGPKINFVLFEQVCCYLLPGLVYMKYMLEKAVNLTDQ